MRDQPDGAMLLNVATEVLRDTLMPLLPPAQRYQALMVLNAMGIAERQLKAGSVPEAVLQSRLAAVLGRQGSLADLEKVLAAAIRRGEADSHQEMQAVLWELAKARAAESAPRALRALPVQNPVA